VESYLTSGPLEEARRELKGWYCIPIPINVEPTPVDDTGSEDVEIRLKVKGMSNGRAGGASRIRVEDLKSWLHGMELEEEKPENHAGAGD
jgi:hypothetical protein